jgi:hypothetical protein
MPLFLILPRFNALGRHISQTANPLPIAVISNAGRWAFLFPSGVMGTLFYPASGGLRSVLGTAAPVCIIYFVFPPAHVLLPWHIACQAKSYAVYTIFKSVRKTDALRGNMGCDADAVRPTV